jgi:hypothetical protein
MSRLRTASLKPGQAYYYIYLQNLPDKYVHSAIFPEVFLPPEIRDDLVEQEVHKKEAYCMFGFKSKQVSNRFEQSMRTFMPAFVLISRRKIEVQREDRFEKEYYDSRNGSGNLTLDTASMQSEQQEKKNER